MKPDRILRLLTVHTVSLACILGLVIAAARPALALEVPLQTEPAAPSAGPDLTVEAITMTPENPNPGDKVDIEFTVKNQGDESALTDIRLDMYVEPADNPPTTATDVTETTQSIGLAPGGTFKYTILEETISAANPQVCGWVDRSNTIAESNEENNLVCLRQIDEPVDVDEYEQDDACDDAKTIGTDGTVQNRNLAREADSGDIDWVKFTVESDVRYTAEAKAVGADADLYVEVHTTCQTPGSFGTGARVEFTALTAGEYYLKVGHDEDDYGPETDYELSIKADNACSASFEPNDRCSFPAELSVSSEPAALDFCEEDDIDWARFAVKAGETYTVSVKNVGSKADVQMSLFSSCEDASSDAGAELRFTAPKPGWVYLKTENKNAADFGAGTEYTLDIDSDGQGCTPDRYENQNTDNTPAAAQPLRVDGNPQQRNICPAGDIDFLTVSVNEGDTFTVETLGLADSADTQLCYMDGDGKELGCDDDSGSGKGSRYTIQNATQTTYLFRIKDRDAQVAGERAGYQVRAISGLCQADEHEEDDERAAAKALAPDGSEREHNICPAADEDWASFDAAADTDYTIKTSDVGVEADTVIELYDAGGNLLAQNDDYQPGIESQLGYRVGAAGTYYVRTRLYNPTKAGLGTEYTLSIRPGKPNAPPTPEARTPTPTPEPDPPAPCRDENACVKTLILVNRQRMVQLHGEESTAQLMTKLTTLAQHAKVRGEVVRLDQNTAINAAYGAWVASLTDVDKANELTTAIRRLIMNTLQERAGVEFIVLVGDDQALPMRRVFDNTTRQSERTYKDITTNHPTGAALSQNYFMTDDFYVDKEPTAHEGREIYIPDLSVGRLIETPADMMRTIDNFVAAPRTNATRALVTGYDFVSDTAVDDCRAWRKVITDGDEQVACLIHGPGKTPWSESELTDLQLREESPYLFQSINGHAFHNGEGVAGGGILTANEIAASSVNFAGGLIYTLGCHGGLNVPPSDGTEPVDLPEVFVRKGANYVGNTGYGWGLLNSIGLSEKVIRLYTNQLLKGSGTMGKSLSTAKRLYFERDPNISAFDEKVVQELIFYGLPMYEIELPASLGPGDEEFPEEIEFDIKVPTGSLGEEDEVITEKLAIDFHLEDGLVSLNAEDTSSGDYQSLNGNTHADAGSPVQPLHFGSLTSSNGPPARSAVILSGTYTQQDEYDPLVGTPVNEYVPRDDDDENALASTSAWYPSTPLSVRTLNGSSNLVTQLSTFNAEMGALRTFDAVEAEVYYSTSADTTAPEFTVVDGLYYEETGTVSIKVGVTDAAGIKDVFLTYVVDVSVQAAQLESTKLSYNSKTQKYTGSFRGGANSRFFVQAVDNAGNYALADNKGAHFQAFRSTEAPRLEACLGECIFLPLVSR